MIRAVISDFGGVLTSPLLQSFVAYERETGVNFQAVGMAMARVAERDGAHPLYELECGRITEAEFFALLEAEVPGASFATFRDSYFAHLEANEPMVDYMRSLRARGLRMALLTNNVREWEPHWRAKIPAVDEIFEVIVDSGFVGMRKPDPRIYELTLERLGDGLRAEECVFVDDLDVNCEAARTLGMRPVLFVSAEKAVAEIEALLNGST
ncbi:MAG: HAD family phosphatase [Actinomycetota bacterium]|nr:HAD family phosphatase [Actinomycetota bacterium]